MSAEGTEELPAVIDEKPSANPEGVVEQKTLLGETDEGEGNVTPEEKAAQDAENKRLLEADDKTLKPEELAKKQELVKAQEEAKANSIPEKYEVKVEGFEVDQPMLDALTPVFKKHNLTQAAVQELATAYAPLIQKQIENQQKTVIDGWNKETESWKAETLKVLGADAKKELAFAAKVINKIGTKYKTEDGKEGNKLRDLLEETRVGNHPEITKLFIELGKKISQDSFVEPNTQPTGKGDFVSSLYTHPTSVASMKK